MFLVATVTVAVVSATTTAFIRPTSKAGSRPTCVTAAWGKQRPLFNSVRVVVPRSTHTRLDSSVAKKTESDPATTSAPVSVAVAVQPGRLSETEINARLAAQLEKMRLKDKMSPLLTKEVSGE